MNKIERFEYILAWKKARGLNKNIYSVAKVGQFARDFGLRDQIQRASVSIMSNIAEGFERGGDKEFIQFLSHAKGSCGEVKSQLYVALDEAYVTPAQFQEMKSLVVATSRAIPGMMGYLKRSELRGPTFRNDD